MSLRAGPELRKFGFNFALGLNILGFIMFLRGRPHFIWFSGVGSFVLTQAILCPNVLRPIKKILDMVIFSVSWVTKAITLLAVFYIIFAPAGVLSKLFRQDFLHRKIDKGASSYWIRHKKTPFLKEFYERMG